MITAAAIEKSFLTPAMEVRALSLRQEQMVREAIAKVRLHAARVYRILPQHERHHIVNLVEFVNELEQITREQQQYVRQVTGDADKYVSNLRRVERNAQAPDPISRLSVTKALRDPLANLLNPAITGSARDAALRAVHDVFDRTPADVVLSSTVAHNLGGRRAALLHRLHADHRGQQ